ncbi:nitric oxide reductase activation protein NorD [Halothiobacillus diazotrophicus]|nr:VWA domain-containing protein [Halothiobacillus diazotrophicus]
MSETLEHDSSAEIATPPRLAFGDMQQRLQLYLTALWGQTFSMTVKPAPDATDAPVKPSLSRREIQFPPSMPDAPTLAAHTVYVATAAHAAAHLQFPGTFDTKELNARQRFMVELLEDARVEYLAARQFPGLRRWWLALHPVEPPDPAPFPALMWRISRGLLLMEASVDDDFLVRKAIALFLERRDRLDDPLVSREVGLRIAHDVGQMRLSMDEGQVPPLPCYRDDNRHLWVESQPMSLSEEPADDLTEAVQAGARMEEAGEGRQLAFIESGQSGGGAEFDSGFRVEATESLEASLVYHPNQAEDAVSSVRYPEWFARLGLERNDWCTVQERLAPSGDVGWAESVLARHRPLLANLRRVVGALHSRQLVRQRKLEQGDELDLDAALRSLADFRNGIEPDPRVFTRMHPEEGEAPAFSLLLDLSESVNVSTEAGGRSILALAREAVLLLAETATDLGSALSLAGFNSHGRHEVDFQRVKGFDEPFDAAARSRLGGLSGRYSTRMGAAIRHATESLGAQRTPQRILLVITDGEPSDIDVFDPEHLLLDARYAVLQAQRRGIHVFCVSLDPGADRYVARIFGPRHFLVLDNLRHLPERLSRLFLRLASVRN